MHTYVYSSSYRYIHDCRSQMYEGFKQPLITKSPHLISPLEPALRPRAVICMSDVIRLAIERHAGFVEPLDIPFGCPSVQSFWSGFGLVFLAFKLDAPQVAHISCRSSCVTSGCEFVDRNKIGLASWRKFIAFCSHA